ncbi:MAG: DivIVA domain-containing protein [bacterium]
MRLTPIDIRKQEFRKAMRGYDADEVDTFLGMVADEMEELITQAEKAHSEVSGLKERLSEYQQMEATMRETLVTVQKAAEEKRDAARKEADMILKEAEVQASNWIEDAHRSVREVKKELARLNGMRDSYVARLKMLMKSQLDMLKMLESEEESPEETLDLFEEKLRALSPRDEEAGTVPDPWGLPGEGAGEEPAAPAETEAPGEEAEEAEEAEGEERAL